MADCRGMGVLVHARLHVVKALGKVVAASQEMAAHLVAIGAVISTVRILFIVLLHLVG